MTNNFIPGLQLSELFFSEVIQPILVRKFPQLRYAAALIGPGSEILGFDDLTSTDHHWGPRLQIFLKENDYEIYSARLNDMFAHELPYTFRGYSTNWSDPDPNDAMNQFLQPKTVGSINHRIEIYTVASYLSKLLALSSLNLSDVDWLLLSEQKLLEFTSGKVFYDDIGELTQARQKLHYYPENIWRFKLMIEWGCIGEEMAFVGRTGSVGDDLGSRIEVTRLTRYIIRLCYLIYKKYPPYPKWLGSGFKQLPIAKSLEPILLQALKTDDWREREKCLCNAYLLLLDCQNKLEITSRIILNPEPYFTRDQLIIDIGKITYELHRTLLPPFNKAEPLIGSVDQFIDNTHILSNSSVARNAVQFYKTFKL